MKTNFLLLLLAICFDVNAQAGHERCGQHAISEFYEMTNEQVIEDRKAIEAFTAEWIRDYQNNPIQSRNIITIPVVVHVVWHHPEENISDLQIKSQIDATNADFRKMNANLNSIPAEFVNLAADIEVEFCLATVDPFGNATDGITRTETDQSNIATTFNNDNIRRIFRSDLGGINGWPTDKYLNIWIGSTGGFELAFACLPGTCPPNEDGIVVDPIVFGTTCNTAPPYNLGRTTTHEIGHFLNLFHVWGTEEDDCQEDDLVEDTPFQNSPNIGCPTHPSESCGSNDMFVNYMDYSDDECMAMFTEGQKLRMLATLNGPRSGLLTSNGCGLITPSARTLNANSVGIFPNPVRDCLHIDVDLDEQEEILITLFNSMGQQLFSSTNTPDDIRSVDVTSLVSGVYFVSFELGNQSVTKRFIVE